MSKRCSVDHKLETGKLAAAYWAWYPEPDVRVAYKTAYCVKHADALLSIIKKAAGHAVDSDLHDDGTCMACGEDLSGGYELTWVNAYMPGIEAIAVTLEHCYTHATSIRAEITEMGERLKDRDVSKSGAPASSPWASLFSA